MGDLKNVLDQMRKEIEQAAKNDMEYKDAGEMVLKHASKIAQALFNTITPVDNITALPLYAALGNVATFLQNIFVIDGESEKAFNGIECLVAKQYAFEITGERHGDFVWVDHVNVKKVEKGENELVSL